MLFGATSWCAGAAGGRVAARTAKGLPCIETVHARSNLEHLHWLCSSNACVCSLPDQVGQEQLHSTTVMPAGKTRVVLLGSTRQRDKAAAQLCSKYVH